jgi:hypothetical protein
LSKIANGGPDIDCPNTLFAGLLKRHESSLLLPDTTFTDHPAGGVVPEAPLKFSEKYVCALDFKIHVNNRNTPIAHFLGVSNDFIKFV